MKLGSTSWLIPGTYLENVEIVADKVDFVELLVFTWDRETERILKYEEKGLLELSKKYGLEYNVHLPTDCVFNVESAFEFFECSNLNISNYILHPIDGIDVFMDKSEKILIENLKEDILIHKKTVFDIGHHLLGMNVTNDFLRNAKEYHVMGVVDGIDHKRLDKNTLGVIKRMMKYSKDLEYICFEVFDLEDFLHSLKLWRDYFDL
ncbi:xylose isomerase [Thermosipho melanesiensis]|uniref:Xylose isomerase domain protein TIM barrel n=2 Tax=Thermosipho melanesiensis TaxID=46541 RepID=A6LLB6_THEM4|nr:cobamide remodeling phosphodiesterase CbiR [Thermosipho melanesiensis]ABR30717.1 hypothetical protein Tmel_0856 [Thermosipho melanesiensis BI429]APT73846.1 xylose isomerase [Thermosipho melanesiensis]OOC35786.1 xylose isomerase [Thermosipho melanesiensis]OOC38288.1 xylose isomerase [Thermosipho melanesiensis]OOC38749.1 xylose isomerase [Thermosipho melanesiensis]